MFFAKFRKQAFDCLRFLLTKVEPSRIFCPNDIVSLTFSRQGGGDVEEAATLTEDSLKASERSLDSLAATRREGPEGGDGGEPSPRRGLAVSWDLSSAGSFSNAYHVRWLSLIHI